jgi:hypothetical protein
MQEDARDHLDRATLRWVMYNLYIYLVFYVSGVIFANFLSASKFVVFALLVSIVYIFYNIFIGGRIGPTVIDGVIGLICVQLGYVCGLALKTAYTQLFPNGIPAPPYDKVSPGKETEVK